LLRATDFLKAQRGLALQVLLARGGSLVKEAFAIQILKRRSQRQ
jgi:hypothetical protein